MSLDHAILTPAERDELSVTALSRHQLEEHFRDLKQQHEVASLGTWIFLATEVMFFGTAFLAVYVYHYLHPRPFEAASARLSWEIGALNTIVLLISSLTIVLAVHYAKHGDQRRVVRYLGLTALLGCAFLGFKALEYYLDYRENLIPNWRFDDAEWQREGFNYDQVQNVKLFLVFYWVMTGLHGLHVAIGIAAVLIMLLLARNGYFSSQYYSPVDVTALYWHFVDVVWIFLLPTLYLLGRHAGG